MGQLANHVVPVEGLHVDAEARMIVVTHPGGDCSVWDLASLKQHPLLRQTRGQVVGAFRGRCALARLSLGRRMLGTIAYRNDAAPEDLVLHNLLKEDLGKPNPVCVTRALRYPSCLCSAKTAGICYSPTVWAISNGGDARLS